ncbi:hypothetical protein [uncultured Thiodictyon sp.]|uniref:hypothetical protein n=1 Tax=uncultured Thiodictyon sp. TaxID=1846217 RepID=UPI0025E25C5A|nr:hypothetical protein [uncultured Thiodictyon sp.]
MSEQGKKLAQCVRAISAYGKEIDALRAVLNGLLLQAIDNPDMPYARHGDPVPAARMDDSEWIYTDVAFSIPLWYIRRGPHTTDMYLGYQISLSGDGIGFSGNDAPLLHVFLWDEPADLEENWMGYPLDAKSEPTLVHNRLIIWPRANRTQWTFSIDLLSLDSSQALLDSIVTPAIALASLEAEDGILQILPDNLQGLVVYKNEDGLIAVDGERESEGI